MTGCEICRRPENLAGVGWRTVDIGPTGRPTSVAPCACTREVVNARTLRKINQELPAWTHNLSFDRNPIRLIPETGLRRIRGYVNSVVKKVDDGKGLWLGGASGTGKTAAASLIVQSARRKGVRAEFVNVPQLLTRLARARYDEDLDVAEEDLHSLLAEIPLLVLDDVSATKTTPFAAEQLYLIVNRRYNRDGVNATIVTSDVDPRELERMFGRRMVRRLLHLAGRPVLLDLDAPAERDEDEPPDPDVWRDGPEITTNAIYE